MNNVDYMQNNKGQITMFCEQLPDKGFIDAVKIRNICIAKIWSAKYKKVNKIEGSQDVEITQASGEKINITRQELVKNFVHCSGKQIKLIHLRSNYKYYVYNVCTQPETYKVLRIPNNCVGSLGTKSVKPGNYIVAKATPDGSIDKESLTVVSEKMFKKSFKIPIQAIIKKHLHKAPNREFGLYNPNRLAQVRGYSSQGSVNEIERSYQQNVQPKHQISLGTGIDAGLGTPNDSEVKIETIARQPVNKPVRMPNIQNIKQPKQTVNNTPQEDNKTKAVYKYTITHRIVSSMNKSLAGFVVKEISSGKSKQLNTQQVMQLCEKHLVDNVILVSKENGMRYLKGNNMRIESLPQVIA